MLSREIGTKLTGRHVSFEVYPLSFQEFLRFGNQEVGAELDYTIRKAVVRKSFSDYLKYGGFEQLSIRQSTESDKTPNGRS
jgi:predicted AAA+ superfamily ATPase